MFVCEIFMQGFIFRLEILKFSTIDDHQFLH